MLAAAFTVTMLVSTAVALVWGGRLERRTAIVLFGAAAVSPLVERANFANIETGVFLIDGLLLGYLVWTAIISDRFWPLWAAAAHFCGTIVHVARTVEPYLFAWTYGGAAAFWAFPVQFALLAGTLLERRPAARQPSRHARDRGSRAGGWRG